MVYFRVHLNCREINKLLCAYTLWNAYYIEVDTAALIFRNRAGILKEYAINPFVTRPLYLREELFYYVYDIAIPA